MLLLSERLAAPPTNVAPDISSSRRRSPRVQASWILPVPFLPDLILQAARSTPYLASEAVASA